MYSNVMDAWDPEKEAANIAKHGIGFAGFDRIWDGPVLTEEQWHGGEQRWKVVGFIDGALMCLIVTERGDDLRPISLHLADGNDRRNYERYQRLDRH